MKTLILTITEFLHFRQVAERYKILFDYGINKGIVTIQAKEHDLETIGF